MKVLLLNPPADDGVRQVREGRCMQRAGAWTAIWTPLSLAYCAAVLRDNGIEVALVDSIIDNLSFNDVKLFVKQYKPNIVVINAVTPAIVSDLSTADYVKEIDARIKIAVIGIHGSSLPTETLDLNNNVDYVIRNEPENTLLSLCRELDKNGDIENVHGISFRIGKQIYHTKDRKFIENLDELPYPAYDLIHSEKYLLPFSSNKFLLIATSRGCCYSCTFCADYKYYGRKIRLRNPSCIVNELEHWKNTLDINHFLFWSESFTLNRDFCIEVAQHIIKRQLNIEWICNSRVDHVDSEMLKVFKLAGCTMIGFGIESGNDDILTLMNKKISTNQIKVAVDLCKESKIEVVGHTIIGYPGETEATIRNTVRFVKTLDIDYVQFYCAVPFPGSKLYEDALINKWICTDDWRLFEQNFYPMHVGELDGDKVIQLRKFAYRSFYLRPKVIWKTLKKLCKQGGISRSFQILKDFKSWI